MWCFYFNLSFNSFTNIYLYLAVRFYSICPDFIWAVLAFFPFPFYFVTCAW